ncbi:MAG: histidinol-phosphate transaminase [Lachnospiraceae bacterium]|nr:histidinol-phosphate transaminase [Lachnospiraceae bacterium]
MSRFFSEKWKDLEPYVPGEQPTDQQYVKLNTNESPFPPSEKAVERAREEAGKLMLYSDPSCTELTKCFAALYGIREDQVIFGNGSDEILNFAFMAFCDEDHPALFPDITYGFYPVFAALNHVPYTEIPLREDFSIDTAPYLNRNRPIFIANPNAPTGLSLPVSAIEEILKTNPDSVVVIDEAYVDFGGESCVPLIEKYDNLLVVQTFSKSRSLAGARLGMGTGNEALIRELHTIRYSTNPYNVNRMTMAAGIGAVEDEAYTRRNIEIIKQNRAWTCEALTALGFSVIPSDANFLFASSDRIDGGTLYRKLKEKGVLVRHFDKERIKGYNRITIGTREQMEILVDKIKEILEEQP